MLIDSKLKQLRPSFNVHTILRIIFDYSCGINRALPDPSGDPFGDPSGEPSGGGAKQRFARQQSNALLGINLRPLSRTAMFCDIRRAYHAGNCIQEHVSRERLLPRMRKEFDFSCFYGAIAQRGLPLPCDSFLSWFVGFTEGDGSFVTVERGKICMFVVTQSCHDVEILYYIQKSLGFGKVYKQGARTSRFVVQDRSGLYILFSLFNGNLVFPRRKAQFKRWVEWAGLGSSERGGKRDPVIHSEILPSLENGWISGLTDSEGCFTASFLSNSTAFRLRFILSQKGDDNLPVLSHLIYLFQGGSIEAHSIKSNYSYILSGVKNCYKIYKYFSTFPLKSKKRESLHLWKSLHVDILQKSHLDLNKRPLLSEKAKRINSIRRKSK